MQYYPRYERKTGGGYQLQKGRSWQNMNYRLRMLEPRDKPTEESDSTA